ncbi:hypothetical protein FACS18942_02450 [Planctomycetales bacterium]|nr:hypothetical protein FACS18942_02450 [Planctomycetales bacterium]
MFLFLTAVEFAGGQQAMRPEVIPYGDVHYGNIRFTPQQTAPPNWTEYFEGKNTSWAALHWENNAGITSQHRTSQEKALQRKGSETVRLKLPPHSSIVLGHCVDFPAIIEDTEISVAVKTELPNVVLAAQIVLPHAIHPDTREPISFIVHGNRYSGSREWEQLGFRDKNGQNNLWKEVSRIGSLLRYGLKMNIDLRDRYVRQIILFCEPDADETADGKIQQAQISTGSLEIYGYVSARQEILAKTETNALNSVPVFDPVNYYAFKLQAGTQCVFLQSYSAKSHTGSTDWLASDSSDSSSPLSAASPKARRIPAEEKRRIYSGGSGTKEQLEVQLTNNRSEIGNNVNNTAENFVSPASSLKVMLAEKVMMLNDRPFGVRCIEYQGEPLSFLRKLEFNTVWVKGKPRAELLREAAESGVWLICPPPEQSEIDSATVYSPNNSQRDRFLGAAQISPVYDNVLVWNFGDNCANREHQAESQRAAIIQNADRMRRRPLLCTARSGVREYSRTMNILMMDRQPLASSLDFFELEKWMSGYPELARPDTPFWCTIQTDVDPHLSEQWTLFGGSVQDICPFTHEQLKMQVFRALAVGSHGLVFTSHSPLNADDPATVERRTSLELLNWELQLLDKWFAEGRSRPTLVNTSLRGKMSGAVLTAGRTRLMLPIWQEKDSQFAVGGAVEGPLSYVVPGIPETYDVYQITPGRLLPLNPQRVAGGVKIELDECCLNTYIYFGENDDVFGMLSDTAREIGPRTAELACKLAAIQLASTERVFSKLQQAKDAGAVPVHQQDHLPVINITEQESLLKETKDYLGRAERLLQQTPPDYSKAYLQAEKSTRGLRVIERSLLQNATRHDLNPCMTPVSVSFATLPLYLSAYQRMMGATLEPVNRLAGGDMENKNNWEQGWSPHLHKVDGVAPPVLEISTAAKYSGNYGLRLLVNPSADAENAKPLQLETAPLYFMTPPVAVKMGEIICTTGWVRIPQKLTSTADGFMVFDSLGGEPLALRFLQTNGVWREFAFYRIAPADGNYFVCFVQHGFGEVHLDDVRISGVQIEVPKPVPAPQPKAPSPWQRFNPLQYLPPLPQWQQGN